MNKLVISTEIKMVIKNLSPPQKKKISGPDGFTGEFHKTFIESIMPMLLKLFQKIADKRTLPNSLYKTTITLIIKSVKDIT